MKKDFTIVERIPFTVMSFGNKCCGSREVSSKQKVPITLDTCEYDVERFKECVVGGITSSEERFLGKTVQPGPRRVLRNNIPEQMGTQTESTP